jgi:hypothetical protein
MSSAMTSREKVLAALSHREGPVPVDFGATIITGMHASVVEALRARCGLPRRPVMVHEPYQMLGLVEDDLKDALGVDTDGAFRLRNMFGVANRDWKPWRTPWGQEVLVPGAFTVKPGADGEVLVFPQGDAEAPPSGRMPAAGFYFDSIVRQEQIEEERLDPADNTVEFGLTGQEDLDHLAAQVAASRAGQRASVASVGGASFGDLAAVTAPFLKQPKGIRDPAEWLLSVHARPAFVEAVFRRQRETAIENLRRINTVMGESIDVVVLSGADFGTQESLFFSVETFDRLFAPHYRAVNDWIHGNTGWKTFIHTDGAIGPLVPSLIASGFDILNPLQYTARGMDCALLKREYGRELVFWGGGLETQHLLPFGKPSEVRAEVLRQCATLHHGGGFVFSTVHNVLAGTPVENIVAMIEAVHEHNGGRA